VYAVTPQKISDVAEQYLQKDRATIVVVGDKKVIEDQIRPFGRIVDSK